MSMTRGGVWNERLMLGDGTICLYCGECCIRPMYLKIVRLMYFGFMVLSIWAHMMLWEGAVMHVSMCCCAAM